MQEQRRGGMQGTAVVSLVAGAASFGACGAAVALVGLGAPFALGALAAAACAGGVVYAVARRSMRPAPPDPAPLQRVKQLESISSALRHDLRGVLSPALMVTDRLLKSDDPKIRKAGEAVVKSIDRATMLLADNKVVESAQP